MICIKTKRIIAILLVLVLCSSLFAYAASGDTIVYITDTGSKYHRSSCGSLWNSSHAVTLQYAMNCGYGACQKCSPPATIAAPMPTKSLEERLEAAMNGEPPSNPTPSSIDQLRAKLTEYAEAEERKRIDDFGVYAGTVRLIVYKNYERSKTYHRAGCPNIVDNPIKENFDDLPYGDNPCTECNPPKRLATVGFFDVLPYISAGSYVAVVGVTVAFAFFVIVIKLRKSKKKKGD